MNQCMHCVIAALVLSLGAACSTTPQSKFYTLNASATKPLRPGEHPLCPADTVISVGPVVLPDLLLRQQIVTRENVHRLHFDEFHRWGGNLDADLEKVLIRNLATLLATEQVAAYRDADKQEVSFRIAVTVEQFDGQLGASLTLAAQWTLTDVRKGHHATLHRATIVEPIPAPGHEALVVAHSAAIEKLARDIAQELLPVCNAPRALAFHY